MKNILYLYNSTQTYTNTVYEHVASFAKYSAHNSFFCHQDPHTELNVDLSHFDAVAIHFSIRLPYDQISPSARKALAEYNGLKFLFIQDEYDHTYRTWHWIKTLGIQLVFTVVPVTGVEIVYPAQEFPGTRFISILTGYVPDELGLNQGVNPPSQRALMVGYRGRPLPIRYGQLGLEKIAIGKIVKAYCDAHVIKNDIAWSEKSRIYGPAWYEFMVSCRSMLGSESGSNVFDWDGTLVEQIAMFRKKNPNVDDEVIYDKFVRANEIEGFMNQVSPRIFEAIASRTVLVLFEGEYSGVVKAGEHFIAVKKDGSNLDEVFRLLADGRYVDAMAERAYQNVIASGKYSYQSFIRLVDQELESSVKIVGQNKADIVISCSAIGHAVQPTPITRSPIRSKPEKPTFQIMLLLYRIWLRLPESVRIFLKPRLKRLLGKG